MARVRVLEGPRRGRRFRVEYYTPEGGHRSRTFPTRKQAEAFLHEVEAAKLRGTYRDPAVAKQALRDYLEAWLASAAHLRPATRALYRRTADRHVLPALGERRLADLDRAACRAFLADLSGRAGAATVEVAHRLLRRVLEEAVRDGILERNPAARLELPRSRPREARFLSAGEIQAIADEVPDRYRALVLLLGYGGLRVGEAAALTVRRLDLPRRRVQVVEAASEVEGRWVLGDTKTGRGRTVALPASVAEALARHVERYTDGRPTSLVFTMEGGGPLRQNAFRKRVFQPAARRAGIVPPPRVHDLRHSAVALAIQAGAHPKLVQELAGHSSIRVTLDRYGHLFPAAHEQLAEALDRVAREAAEGGRVLPLGRR
ncbi:MAG TPA: tyrosine-type recombinase/integrase [Actinomycetota bacterium]|nr:tyrosine-type recombinase/integrase [Actinomycetota bacterium]